MCGPRYALFVQSTRCRVLLRVKPYLESSVLSVKIDIYLKTYAIQLRSLCRQLHLLRVPHPAASRPRRSCLRAAGRVLWGPCRSAGLPYLKQYFSIFLCYLLPSVCMVLKAFSPEQCCSSCQNLLSFGRCISSPVLPDFAPGVLAGLDACWL